MDVVLSSSIVIALATGSLSDTAAEVWPTPAEAAIAELQVRLDPPLGYVIVDIPAFNRNDATGQRRDHNRAENLAPYPERPASVGSREPQGGTAFETAVTAAHDARIVLIEHRIDRVLNEQPGDKALLRDLTVRLERAQAARRLSLERAVPANAVPARRAVEAEATRPVPRSQMFPRESAKPARRNNVAEDMAPPKRVPVRSHEGELPKAAIGDTADQSSELVLKRSRASLATARKLLVDRDIAPPAWLADADAEKIGWGWPAPIIQFILALAALLIVLVATRRRPELAPAMR